MNFLDEIKGERDFERFVNLFKKRIKSPLPGEKAQLKMASTIRNKELNFKYDTSKAIHSSVLILFFPVGMRIKTVFILRQTYDGVHSGQVSFPGGRLEKNDQSLIHTALREAGEEVNIKTSQVKIIGTLSELYIPPSNFLVLPVVGYTLKRPSFKPDKTEVAEVIEADISFLFDQNLKKEKVLDVRGYKIKAPYFDVNGHTIWGATAMILSELREVIESIN
jgi:8-oxo-dGTP pyrophosphatase MutT (NUDIX family)